MRGVHWLLAGGCCCFIMGGIGGYQRRNLVKEAGYLLVEGVDVLRCVDGAFGQRAYQLFMLTEKCPMAGHGMVLVVAGSLMVSLFC